MEKENGLNPLNKKEKVAFYLFEIAIEPFFVVALSICIPLILLQLANQNSFGQYEQCIIGDVTGCMTYFFTFKVKTSSYVQLGSSLSVVIQALVFISLSALADHGKLKKIFLFLFGYLGSLFCILFLSAYNSSLYWLAGIYAVFTNVCFGSSYVFYNAYIPTLTALHQKVVQAKKDYENKKIEYKELNNIIETQANNLSGIGYALGFLASIGILIIMGILVYYWNTTFVLQICVAIIGLWFIIWSSYALLYLQSRPGPSFPKEESYIIYGWKKFIKTISNIKKLSQLFKFLLAWFFLSDAIFSIVSICFLVAQKRNFPDQHLFIIAFVTSLSAAIGSYSLNLVKKAYRISTKRMIIMVNILFMLPILYILAGLITYNPIKKTFSFGLTSLLEIYFIASYEGFFYAAIQSLYRVQFSEIIPKGKENEFFGLYAITDKGSSWLGPLVCAIIAEYSELEFGFIYILIGLSLPLLLTCRFSPIISKQQALQFEVI